MSNLLAQVKLHDTFFQGVKAGTVPTVYELIAKILPNAYIIAGLILFIYTIAGGFMIISSAGNPEATKEGQKIITNAIIGFVVIFCSYWIIQIIEIVTGVQILAPILKI
jgi:hypothetical protein